MTQKELKIFVGKKVIISFKDWEDSKDKRHMDMSKQFLPSRQIMPDLFYRKKDKVEAEIKSVDNNSINFFVYEERVIFLRSIEDIDNIQLC